MSDQPITFIAIGLTIAFFIISLIWYLENKQKEDYHKRARMIRYVDILQNLAIACEKGFKDRKLINERLEFSLRMHFSTDDFDAIRKLLTENFFEKLTIDEKELHRFVFKSSKNSLMQTYKSFLVWSTDPDNQKQISTAIAWYREKTKPKIKKLRKAEKKVAKINEKLDKAYKFTAKPPNMNLEKSLNNLNEQLKKWTLFFENIHRSDQMPIVFLADQPKEPTIPLHILGDLNCLLNILNTAQKPYEQKTQMKVEKRQQKIRKKEEKKEAKARKKQENSLQDHDHKPVNQENKRTPQKKVPKIQNNHQTSSKNKKEEKPSLSREERTTALGMGEPNQ